MEKTLAARLHDFYNEVDFYDYMDVVAVSEESATIAALEQQLQDNGLTHGILTALTHIQEESDLSTEQTNTLGKLINDVGLHEAKMLIDDFCRREYGNGEQEYDNLSEVPIAYTTTEDGEHEIQVNINLVKYNIETNVDHELVHCRSCDSLKELIETELQDLNFDDLISVSDEELVPFYAGENMEQGML